MISMLGWCKHKVNKHVQKVDHQRNCLTSILWGPFQMCFLLFLLKIWPSKKLGCNKNLYRVYLDLTNNICELVRPKNPNNHQERDLLMNQKPWGFNGLKRGCVTNWNMIKDVDLSRSVRVHWRLKFHIKAPMIDAYTIPYSFIFIPGEAEIYKPSHDQNHWGPWHHPIARRIPNVINLFWGCLLQYMCIYCIYV